MMFVEPRFIPTLLLDGGRFVKTRRFADPVYVGDPVNVLSIFNEFVVDEIIILDITAAVSRLPESFERLRRYAEECFIPLAYGGVWEPGNRGLD
jgi:cyclase